MNTSILVFVGLILFHLGNAEEDEIKLLEVARYHHFYHGDILWHAGFGILAVLAIIKIVLGISFVGMVTALLHMFAGIKYLLKNTEAKSEPTYYHMPYYHHSHEEIEHHPWEHEHHHSDPPYPYRRQDLTGGRSMNEKSKERRKRELAHILNEDSSVPLKRVSRSVETSNDNCKKKLICQLHARARHSPFRTFQLYFIKKDGLAQYWDFVDRPYEECGKVYPCRSHAQSITQKEPMKEIEEPKDHTDYKVIHEGRGFRQYYDSDYNYSTEYESEYQPENYEPEEYSSNNWWWSQ